MFWHFEWGRRRLWIFSRILRCFFSAFYVRDFLCVACFEIFNQRFNPTLIMTGDNKQCATIEQYAQVTKLQPWRPPGHVCSLFSHHMTTRGLHQSDLSTMFHLSTPKITHFHRLLSRKKRWHDLWYVHICTCHRLSTVLILQPNMSYHVHTFVTSVSRVEAVAMAVVVELQVTSPGESAAALQHSLVCHRWRFSRRSLEIFQPCLWQTKP